MPTDVSGVYSLPAGYFATTGTTITTSQHNPIFEDVEAALTARMPRNGAAPMTGPLKLADGAVGAPALALASNPTWGFYKTATGWGLSIGGVKVFEATPTDHMMVGTGSLQLPSGTTAQRTGTPAAGMFRYNSDTGNPEFYSAQWTAVLASLSGAQMAYGAIINGTLVESRSAGAVTFALKTLAGTDPSATDPVLLAFRNATAGTGNYVYRTVTAALSLVIPSGATMQFTNATPGKLWAVLFDDAGTIRLGAINCLNGTNIYPLGKTPLASSTTISTGADNAHVFYTNAGVTSKPYLVLGSAEYASGLAAAGTWDAAPAPIELFGLGQKLPGDRIQSVYTSTTTVGSTSSASFVNLTNGFTLSITPTSAANLIEVSAIGSWSNASNAVQSLQLVRGSTLIGFPIVQGIGTSAFGTGSAAALRAVDAPGVTTSTTYQVQGKTNAGTLSYPAANSGADLSLCEIMT